MRTDRELLQSALDALNLINHRGNTDDELMQVGQTITQIQERLAEPKEEPVAWLAIGEDGEGRRAYLHKQNALEYTDDIAPLYCHPQRPTGLDQLLERIKFLDQQIAERKNQ